MVTPAVLFDEVDELRNEEGARAIEAPRNIVWSGSFEGNEILFDMGHGDGITLHTTWVTWPAKSEGVCSGFSPIGGHPGNPITIASAGLHDDDLGLVDQMPAMTVVENGKDGVVTENISLFVTVPCPADPIQNAMGHEHQECAV